MRPPLNIGLSYIKIFVDLHFGQIPVAFKFSPRQITRIMMLLEIEP